MKSFFVNMRVKRIKGKEEDINRFIEEYKPFIASCTQKVTGRYVSYGEDDELSISLMAFAEAINSFDAGKGRFLPFAENVIRRRLIDYLRKENRYRGVIPIDSRWCDAEETEIETRKSMEKFSMDEAARYRKMEIEELKNELLKWGISFFELADVSPKHKKTRELYRNVINYILERPELVSFMKSKKYLPVSEIEKNTGIPRKKIDRARKYIIAVVVIMTGDYKYIQYFIDDEVKRPKGVMA
jgi:RNA polymerase sigma factor